MVLTAPSYVVAMERVVHAHVEPGVEDHGMCPEVAAGGQGERVLSRYAGRMGVPGARTVRPQTQAAEHHDDRGASFRLLQSRGWIG